MYNFYSFIKLKKSLLLAFYNASLKNRQIWKGWERIGVKERCLCCFVCNVKISWIMQWHADKNVVQKYSKIKVCELLDCNLHLNLFKSKSHRTRYGCSFITWKKCIVLAQCNEKEKSSNFLFEKSLTFFNVIGIQDDTHVILAAKLNYQEQQYFNRMVFDFMYDR